MFKEQADPEGYRKVVEESEKNKLENLKEKEIENISAKSENKNDLVDLTGDDIVNLKQEKTSKEEKTKYVVKSKKKSTTK